MREIEKTPRKLIKWRSSAFKDQSKQSKVFRPQALEKDKKRRAVPLIEYLLQCSSSEDALQKNWSM